MSEPLNMMQQLNERVNKDEAAYVQAAIQPTLNWESIVGYLQHCADNDLGEPVNILTYRLPVAEQLDSIKPVVEYFNNNLDKNVLGAEIFVGLTTKQESKYTSNHSTLLWQLMGQATFSIRGEKRFLVSGDLVFIPKETEYIVKPDSANAHVLFSLNKGEDVDD